jgi:hypothetical protein
MKPTANRNRYNRGRHGVHQKSDHFQEASDISFLGSNVLMCNVQCAMCNISPPESMQTAQAHLLVERGVAQPRARAHVLVQDAHNHHRQRCKHHVVDGEVPVVVDGLPAEEREPVEPEEREAEDDVLVEEVAHHARDALVAPAAVDQEQPLQEAELGDGEVARHNRLEESRLGVGLEVDCEQDSPLAQAAVGENDHSR